MSPPPADFAGSSSALALVPSLPLTPEMLLARASEFVLFEDAGEDVSARVVVARTRGLDEDVWVVRDGTGNVLQDSGRWLPDRIPSARTEAAMRHSRWPLAEALERGRVAAQLAATRVAEWRERNPPQD